MRGNEGLFAVADQSAPPDRTARGLAQRLDASSNMHEAD